MSDFQFLQFREPLLSLTMRSTINGIYFEANLDSLIDEPYCHFLLKLIFFTNFRIFAFLFFIHFYLFYLFLWNDFNLPKSSTVKIYKENSYQSMKPVSFLMSWQILSQLPCHYLRSIYGERSIDAQLCLWDQVTYIHNEAFWVIVLKELTKIRQTKVGI